MPHLDIEETAGTAGLQLAQRAKTPNWQVKELDTRTMVLAKRERNVQLFGLNRPHLAGVGAEGEVHGEKTGKEHQLAGEPHNGSDRNHVGAVQRWMRRGTGGVGCSCHKAIMSINPPSSPMHSKPGAAFWFRSTRGIPRNGAELTIPDFLRNVDNLVK